MNNNAQPRRYPTSNSNNGGMAVGPQRGPGIPAPPPPPPPPPPPQNGVVLTDDEKNRPEECIKGLMEQIAAIPIPPNQQNTGPLHDEVRLYKRIKAIIDFRLTTLENDINAIQQGGRKVRRRNRKTKRRHSR